MKLLTTLFTTSMLTLSAVAIAEAAPHVDLGVTLNAPAVHVYEAGSYAIQVGNTGNRNATGVVLRIDLPRAATSPGVAILGTLGARDSRCTLSGARLTCNLGTVVRATSTTVAFTLTLPYSTAPLVIAASATSAATPPELTPANNSVSHTAQLATYPASLASGSFVARVCSGETLTSFFECELFPSSISQFTGTLEADHTITVTDEPGVTGTWSLAGDTLSIEYFDGAISLGAIQAKSVGGGCFEGVMAFEPPYVAPHEYCVF